MTRRTVLVNIFCTNLRRIRKEKGVTQVEMAARLGVSQASYSYLERGGYAASLETIERVSSAIGIAAFELLVPYSTPKKSEQLAR